jgi:penicillin amidase
VSLKRTRLFLAFIAVLLAVAIAAAGWIYYRMQASLPQLDGVQGLAGLSGSVTVTRDSFGVPTIRGETRADVARAIGVVHAQDRFFQMDLLRRRAAGELAELVGKIALPLDRGTRPHHFRSLAQQVLASLPADQRDLLEAYAAGVNAGLSALGDKPFEYVLIRSKPAPWLPEDSVLIVYAMTLDLQEASNTYELSLTTLRDKLGPEAVAFFAPLLTPADGALDDSNGPLAPIPSPQAVNFRAAHSQPRVSTSGVASLATTLPSSEDHAGSNSFALSGKHTQSGAAMLANDPHLNLGIPNIWYRAMLEWPVQDSGATPRNRIVGVSIPGVPFIVIGSNGHVAWGLTDAAVDTNDLVAVDVASESGTLYRAPGSEDLNTIEVRRDTINVKGGEPEIVETEWTDWGPVVARDFRKRPLAHRWIAHDPAATNLNFIRLETARNVTDAIAIAHDSGIPANTFLVADRAGDIAWTIAGKFPKRSGFDGRLPVAWTFGDRGWKGLVPASEVPVISTAAGAQTFPSASALAQSGRLWTANNRLFGGATLELLGDGGYAPAPRAVQIRDQLAKLEKATPRDFLSIQLDHRGLYLERWQQLLLEILTPENVAQNDKRAELRRLIEAWDGRASVDSVSYRLVKTFRAATADRVFIPIFAPCAEAFPGFDWRKFDYEHPLWTVLQEEPLHLLEQKYSSWRELLLAAADDVPTRIQQDGSTLSQATWGERNRAKIRHPMAGGIPFGLGRWLNLPNDPLPGDTHMPLIQSPAFGASMRLIVSPGREHEGLFSMPGGQSGHPLSTFYRAGHSSWVQGEAAPLLPGKPQHTLQLVPE